MLSIRHTRKIDQDTHSPKSTSWSDVRDDLILKILRGDYEEGGALPSVRSEAKRLGAHHETIRKGYDALACRGVIVKQPRQQAIVAVGARDQLRRSELVRFSDQELPILIKRMEMLGLSSCELKTLIDRQRLATTA